jgi:uncharacterized protein with HEPN domain
MQNKFGDRARVRHILDAISEIELYINDTEFEDFSRDSMKKHATVKQLEIIGEAANHLSEMRKERYSQVEWREIIGLRNILIHEYFGVDERIIWEIVTNDLPKLKDEFKKMLKELS